VVVARASPLLRLVTVTLAPGMMAPLESVTAPVIAPRSLCP